MTAPSTWASDTAYQDSVLRQGRQLLAGARWALHAEEFRNRTG